MLLSVVMKHQHEPVEGDVFKASTGQIIKAGAVGAVAGYTLFDDSNPILSSIVGAAALAAGRKLIPGSNINSLKLRSEVYRKADIAEQIGEGLKTEASMLMTQIKKHFPDGKSQREFVFALENKKLRKDMTPDQIEVVKIWQKTLENFRKVAIKAGVLVNEVMIKEYVTHIFKGKEPPASAHRKFSKILNSHSGFAQQRKILKTIEEISKTKKYDIETDPLLILDAYTRSMSKAIMGKTIVNDLRKSAILHGEEKLPLIVFNTEKSIIDTVKKLGYKRSDHPALRESWIHPIIKDAIEDFYRVDVGTNLIWDKLLVVNNTMKRLAVMLSFFHAQALVLSSVYAGSMTQMLTKSGRVRMKRVKNLLDAKWDPKNGFIEGELATELHAVGMKYGHAKESQMLNPGYDSAKNLVDKWAPPLGKAQDFIDKWTWDVLHDQNKIFSYLLHKERIMKMGMKDKQKGGKGITEREAGEISAEFVNDAYGGLNWTKLAIKFQQKALDGGSTAKGLFYDLAATAISPSKRRNANMVLFAPDWTLANLRVAFRGLGFGKDLAQKIIKGKYKSLTVKEKAQFKMYNGYLVRATASTAMLAYMMHELFADEDDEFDLKEFLYTGRLSLGQGQEMVVSKQLAEGMHWLTAFQHTAWNKSAAMPKMIAELTLGKEYISFKHDAMVGPKLNLKDPAKAVEYFTSKVTPISLSPYKQALHSEEEIDNYETFIRTGAGAFGFPIYGKRKIDEPYY